MWTHLDSSEMFLTNKDVFGGLMYLVRQLNSLSRKKYYDNLQRKNAKRMRTYNAPSGSSLLPVFCAQNTVRFKQRPLQTDRKTDKKQAVQVIFILLPSLCRRLNKNKHSGLVSNSNFIVFSFICNISRCSHLWIWGARCRSDSFTFADESYRASSDCLKEQERREWKKQHKKSQHAL